MRLGRKGAAAAAAEEPAGSRKKEKAQAPLDYVIMSLPVRAEGEKPTVWTQHVDFVTKEKIGRSAQFEIPDLPVGTFDTLMSLSDELGRVDTFAESLCRKVITTLTELYNSPSLHPPHTHAPQVYGEKTKKAQMTRVDTQQHRGLRQRACRRGQ